MALLELSLAESNVDNLGHLGGFYTGALFSLVITPVLATSMNRHRMPGLTYEKYCMIGGAILLLLWLGIGMAMLFTQRNPAQL